MDPLTIHFAWLSFIAVFISVFAMNIVIITVHEFGHGIAYLVNTNNNVDIFLGSHGSKKNLKIIVGKFTVWIKPNIFTWKGGLCVLTSTAAAKLTTKQRFNCTLAGPMASLLLSAILAAILIVLRPQGAAGAFFFIFCIFSFWIFLSSIVPREQAIIMNNGNVTYNDGYKLRQILRDKKLPEAYLLALRDYKENRYTHAETIFDELISQGTKKPEVYRMAIATCIALKNYPKANQLQKEQIQKIGNINTQDRCTAALIKTLLGNYTEAIAYYKHLLMTKDGKNKTNLNNLGYTLTLTGRYEEAIIYLDIAIAMDKNFAYAYSNRAYAKMKMGHWEEGNTDNELSLQLDKNNAHAWRNAGLYYFEHCKYDAALQAFENARSIDDTLESINRYISDTEWHLAQQNNED